MFWMYVDFYYFHSLLFTGTFYPHQNPSWRLKCGGKLNSLSSNEYIECEFKYFQYYEIKKIFC